MFTGIIEEIGKIRSVVYSSNFVQLKIEAELIMEDISVGDSISTNGVCLTVAKLEDGCFVADVMSSTIRHSNLKELKPGYQVNLERAMGVSDRFGGHIVQGHVDGLGTIRQLKKDGNAILITIHCDSSLLKYIVPRGSIALDGISLTVVYAGTTDFQVSLIPTTQKYTILPLKKVGDTVNLECDVIGKYLEKLIAYQDRGQSKLSMEYLNEQGFY